MTRRERIKSGMRSGGTAAPSGRGHKPKRSQVAKGQGRERVKAGLAKARPARGGGRAGVQDRAQAGIGRQLTRRADSGAISQEQAQRTAGERSQLADAYGPDWRTKVYGDRGYVQRTRMAAAEDPEDERVQALLAMLLERRRRMLEAATPGEEA